MSASTVAKEVRTKTISDLDDHKQELESIKRDLSRKIAKAARQVDIFKKRLTGEMPPSAAMTKDDLFMQFKILQNNREMLADIQERILQIDNFTAQLSSTYAGADILNLVRETNILLNKFSNANPSKLTMLQNETKQFTETVRESKKILENSFTIDSKLAEVDTNKFLEEFGLVNEKNLEELLKNPKGNVISSDQSDSLAWFETHSVSHLEPPIINPR